MSESLQGDARLTKFVQVALSASTDGESVAAINAAKRHLVANKKSAGDVALTTDGAKSKEDGEQVARWMNRAIAAEGRVATLMLEVTEMRSVVGVLRAEIADLQAQSRARGERRNARYDEAFSQRREERTRRPEPEWAAAEGVKARTRRQARRMDEKYKPSKPTRSIDAKYKLSRATEDTLVERLLRRTRTPDEIYDVTGWPRAWLRVVLEEIAWRRGLWMELTKDPYRTKSFSYRFFRD